MTVSDDQLEESVVKSILDNAGQLLEMASQSISRLGDEGDKEHGPSLEIAALRNLFTSQSG